MNSPIGVPGNPEIQAEARSLVLGGGGVAGIAWMTGLLHGLEKSGVDLSAFGTILGTSAGAAVAAQVYGGPTLEQQYARQVDSAEQVAELVPPVSLKRLLLKLLPALLVRKQPLKFRRKVGRMALAAKSVPAQQRYQVIEQRLQGCQWPTQDLKVVVVNANTGEVELFDRHSGVSLTDAVAASCAVPGIWPVVKIKGKPYIDGGIRSANSADYVLGAKKVLVLAPMGYKPNFTPDAGLRKEVLLLRESGSQVLVLTPDDVSVVAMGKNPLDPNTRAPSARAGHEQAAAVQREVLELLQG